MLGKVGVCVCGGGVEAEMECWGSGFNEQQRAASARVS